MTFSLVLSLYWFKIFVFCLYCYHHTFGQTTEKINLNCGQPCQKDILWSPSPSLSPSLSPFPLIHAQTCPDRRETPAHGGEARCILYCRSDLKPPETNHMRPELLRLKVIIIKATEEGRGGEADLSETKTIVWLETEVMMGQGGRQMDGQIEEGRRKRLWIWMRLHECKMRLHVYALYAST